MNTINMMQHMCGCDTKELFTDYWFYTDKNHRKNYSRYCMSCYGLILTFIEETMMEAPAQDETNPKDKIGVKKPRLSLVPPAGLIHESLAMANGADKYGPYNWRDKKVQMMIYLEAAVRHILSFQDGEEVASDSGVHHLGHARACLGIILDAIATDSIIDNRPKKGCAASLIERFTKK